MKTLSGLDGAFLHLETEATPMHVASLHRFDPPAGKKRLNFLAEIRKQLRDRLSLAPVLTRRLAPMPLQFANPVWIEDTAVDIDQHVTGLRLPAPGGQRELEDCVATLHAQLLDRSRPLWQITVIDGLASGQLAYYVKIHHALLDGKAGVMLAQVLFDATPEPAPSPAPQPRRRASPQAEPPAQEVAAEPASPGLMALAGAALKHDAAQYIKLVRHLPEVVTTLAGLLGVGGGPKSAPAAATRDTETPDKAAAGKKFTFGPKTALNVPITGERSFAGLSLPLEAIKALAARHEVKVNDIVLALCSGTLRRYLARHGGIPRKPLIATMPISLRAAGNTEFTTQATLSLVSLHSHLADPLRRLRAIRDAAGSVKAMARTARNVIPTDFPSIGSPWLLQSLATLYGKTRLAGAMPPIANVVISNVPGPPVPLYAAGARMTDYWPLSITEHGVGLNLTVMSYAHTMGFGFTAARCAVPDARELTSALMEAFEELQALPVKAAPTPASSTGATGPARKVAAKKVAARKTSAGKAAVKKAPARKPAAP
jgi:WS/DGAT/MGAT family acyltransferase